MEIPKEIKEKKGSGEESAQLLYQEVLAELKWLVLQTASCQLKWIVSSLSQALCSSLQL